MWPEVWYCDDIAAGKPAIQMQAEESPLNSNVFICFGAFHITLAYFAGIGFVLAESVGTDILVETQVLALDLLMVSWLGSITTDAKDYIHCWPMSCTYYTLKASCLKMVHYLHVS